MKEPWSLDANNIEAGTLNSFPLIKNKTQEKFLNIKDDKTFFVVAAKGFGKTHLLKEKAANYRKQGSHLCLPGTESLCEKISPITGSGDLPKQAFEVVKGYPAWRDIWRICLSIPILSSLGVQASAIINERFAKVSTVSSCLVSTLNRWRDFIKYRGQYITDIDEALRAINQSVVMFVDNIDEALDEHVGLVSRDSSARGYRSPDIWTNAQLGFMDAAKQINQINPHIKIFASIRLEAWTNNPSSTASQLSDNAVLITYTPKDLKQIFESRIKLVNDENLVNPNSEDIITRFLGAKTIDNMHVRDDGGNPIREDVFSYILRHTLLRPRDILAFGKEIDDIPVEDRNPIRLRVAINSAARTLLEEYKKQVVPYWDDDKHNLAIREIKTNTLTRSEIERINKTVSKYIDPNGIDKESAHVFCSMYSRGLLGVIRRKDYGNEYFQHFEPVVSRSDGYIRRLPESEYYLLHPCVSEHLSENQAKLDKVNVIGYDLPFRLPVTRRRPLHLHFGAGKLGLGFVVPLFLGRSGVCIVQRPTNDRDTSEWQKYINSNPSSHLDRIKVKILSGEDPCIVGYHEFHVVHDGLPEEMIRQAIEHWKDGEGIIALTKYDSDLCRRLVEMCASASTSLRHGIIELEKVAKTISRSASIPIYAFENRMNEVSDCADIVKGINPKISICPAVVDCICLSLSHVTPNEVIVKREKYGRAYLVGDAVLRCHYSEIDQLQLVNSSEELHWHASVKKLLFNDIHAAIGFLAWSVVLLDGGDVRTIGYMPVTSVLRMDVVGDALEVLGRVQACRLIVECEKYIQSNGHLNKLAIGVIFSDLIAQFSSNLERIRECPDILHRLLEGDDPKAVIDLWKDRVSGMARFGIESWDSVLRLGIQDIPDKYKVNSILLRLSDDLENIVQKAIVAYQVSSKNAVSDIEHKPGQ